MKKFFQSKRNLTIVASTIAVLTVVAVGITIIVTTAKNRAAYALTETEPAIITQTESPTVSVTETEPIAESITEPVTASPISNTTDAPKKGTDSQNNSTSKSPSGESSNNPIVSPPKIDNLIGNWNTTESIAPSELISDEFLSITGFNMDMQIYIMYRFSSDKSFSIEYYVKNYTDYVDSLYDAYAIYLKSINPNILPENFEHDVRQGASDMMNELCQAAIGGDWGANMSYIFGDYSYDDSTIRYQCDSTSFSETYMLDGDMLKLTGSSLGNEGYPITLKRV